MKKLFIVYFLIAALALVFVFGSAIDTVYQNQPNPSQPATELSVRIGDNVTTLQDALDQRMIGGEAGTNCSDNMAMVAFDEQSKPTCLVIR